MALTRQARAPLRPVADRRQPTLFSYHNSRVLSSSPLPFLSLSPNLGSPTPSALNRETEGQERPIQDCGEQLKVASRLRALPQPIGHSITTKTGGEVGEHGLFQLACPLADGPNTLQPSTSPTEFFKRVAWRMEEEDGRSVHRVDCPLLRQRLQAKRALCRDCASVGTHNCELAADPGLLLGVGAACGRPKQKA